MSHALTVERAELVAALKALPKMSKPRRTSEAVLSWSEGRLSIDLPGVGVGVPAVGVWPGTVRVKGEFILTLAKVPPIDDPVSVRVQDGRLRIEDSSFPCVVEAADRSAIDLPVDAPLDAVLHVMQEHSDDEIARSGLAPLVRQAQDRRDVLIARAAEVLQPLLAEVDDLRRLVDGCVLRKYKGPR